MKKIREVAEIMSVSQMTVRRWIESGRIKSVRIGGVVRIPDEEVERLKKGEQ